MAVTIDAGALDQRITLRQRAFSANALGENAQPWQDVATVWAQAQPLRGSEFFAAGQMQSTADVRFRIRWRSGVTGAMQVVWRGNPHDIVGEPIDVGGQKVYLELMCISGVRDGRV